ncbi:MAG TPA: hypothetical protein VID51_09860 [Solirubrobacterales bacterium]
MNEKLTTSVPIGAKVSFVLVDVGPVTDVAVIMLNFNSDDVS